MRTLSIDGDRVSINTSGPAPGLYFMEAQDGGRFSSVGGRKEAYLTQGIQRYPFLSQWHWLGGRIIHQQAQRLQKSTMAPKYLYILICMAMTVAFTYPVTAQPHPALRGVHINVSMGYSTPDRRLQSWPELDSYGPGIRATILDNNSHSNDDWRQILIEKHIELGRYLSIRPGVGYARIRGDFPNIMSADPSIFILQLAGRHDSHNYMVSLPIGFTMFRNSRLATEVGANPVLLMNSRTVLFTRAQQAYDVPVFSTSAFGIHSISFNPYARIRFQRLYLMGSVRANHLKWPERAPVWRFQNKVDAHNPLAIFISLGFDIFGSVKREKTRTKGAGASVSKVE